MCLITIGWWWAWFGFGGDFGLGIVCLACVVLCWLWEDCGVLDGWSVMIWGLAMNWWVVVMAVNSVGSFGSLLRGLLAVLDVCV